MNPATSTSTSTLFIIFFWEPLL